MRDGTVTTDTSTGGDINVEELKPYMFVIIGLGVAVALSYGWSSIIKRMNKE